MARLDDSRFGPNLWLMQEMHERYLDQPDAVSEAWREFFEDYLPPDRAVQQAPSSPLRPPAPAHQDGEAGKAPTRRMSSADRTLASKMEESLSIPTATSVRTIPAKLLEVNRNILNNHQVRTLRKKLSFTHLLGWAVVKAVIKHPHMNVSFQRVKGDPHLVRHSHVNLGVAVDIRRSDGSRALVVPSVKAAENMTFSEFVDAYDEVVRRAHAGKLTPDDVTGTTITVTNPGTVGTVLSIPRLMAGQGVIVGIGAMDYPAEYQGADPHVLADIGIGKVITISSTYDHRVIQGAVSGEFLGEIHQLLMGADGFYEEIFASMGVPYVPVEWHEDVNPSRDSLEAEEKQARVFQLINIYRVRGHLIADLDPLDTNPPKMHPDLDPARYRFSIWDLDRTFATGGLAGHAKLKLGQILKILRDAYCRTTGIEYMHISEPSEKEWIQQKVEGVSVDLPKEDHARIMQKLNEAESFETFLHTRYVGHKRFSLEGAISLIPMLDAILDAALSNSLDEAVIGMAHRGRLNVLANIIGKSHRQIFKEFEGHIDPETVQGSGDVKYHIGATGTYLSPRGGSLPVSVVSNPSHLESVDPVVEGVVRAKQDRLNRLDLWPVLPILIHGDAAFAGQGVVAETLNLSQLRGYRTGGTIHIIINNQLGFTAGAGQTRSSTYASDVAKMIQAPILHVNGDDPEACLRAARLAFEYREHFHKDVVIDMWCYRRWGHNEADEPAYTQPLMYQRIASRRSVRKLYTELLLHRGDITIEQAEGALEDYRARLQEAFDASKGLARAPAKRRPLAPMGDAFNLGTAVGLAKLKQILETTTRLPPGFAVHPKLGKWLEDRRNAFTKDHIDWSLAESLAFGSLLADGVSVRLAGQDTRRGTFSQRHAVLIDQENGSEYLPLAQVPRNGARMYIYDSLLSEFAALGFEYGYSVAASRALVLWEAQFGDFANGGQVIIDQFISAGEAKWGQPSNLVMLLPHGYEGQGPEHSSARLERFLMLGAEDNFRVVVPSTPAQYFHLLRGQGRSTLRRPLIILTPKSLLRLPRSSSKVLDLLSGGFRAVLSDPSAPDPDRVRRLIMCTGKIYYELEAAREKLNAEGVALVRVERLYPFPADEIAEEIARFDQAEIMWVQEEPENMGAWRFVHQKFNEELKASLLRCCREESASPATGSSSIHEREQEFLLHRALAGMTD
ncbi:MAG: multifunctional oxoglutarate decarboxylase/oxoglutarate dehydrogenase thiamine pyrophosphate-binding subunit/dihydrolipoyllysine-residue succinyltransferase subunit [Actinomycetota bacterium]|nr:multifunctional oxoglutarate decarboxylase/oxoglutarate dehydrogenase thiamine pyrophosphate-binding subunit/dihydrolipoyllysine-residue succinyltransferase subunit [Actinomycetota bacterium]